MTRRCEASGAGMAAVHLLCRLQKYLSSVGGEAMQCGELCAELPDIAARTQLHIFQYQITLFASNAVDDGLRYAHSVGRGEGVESCRFRLEHRVIQGVVQLEKITFAVRSIQAECFIDAAAADRSSTARLKRAICRLVDGGGEVGKLFLFHVLKRRSPCSVKSNIGPQATSQ